MASENTDLYENLPRNFAIIPASTTNPGSDDSEVTNKKKTFYVSTGK